jgi:hypothetical protein
VRKIVIELHSAEIGVESIHHSQIIRAWKWPHIDETPIEIACSKTRQISSLAWQTELKMPDEPLGQRFGSAD